MEQLCFTSVIVLSHFLSDLFSQGREHLLRTTSRRIDQTSMRRMRRGNHFGGHPQMTSQFDLDIIAV